MWLVFGRRLLAAAGTSPALGLAAHLSIGWLFVNWWAHDGLHRSAFGQTFVGVATIDVIFHTSLIAATAVAAAYAVVAARASVRNEPHSVDAHARSGGAVAEA